MLWYSLLLLTLDFVGFVLLLVVLAGGRVRYEIYTSSLVLLLCIGSTTAAAHAVLTAVDAFLLRPPWGVRLRRRLRRTLDTYAALLAVSTALMMAGATGRGREVLAIAAAAGSVVFCLLLLRQFRRYSRWRSICLRRETRSPGRMS